METFKIKQHTNKYLVGGGRQTFWQIVSFKKNIKYIEDIFVEYSVPSDLKFKLDNYRKCPDYHRGMFYCDKGICYTILFQLESKKEAKEVLDILNSIVIAHKLIQK